MNRPEPMSFEDRWRVLEAGGMAPGPAWNLLRASSPREAEEYLEQKGEELAAEIEAFLKHE